MDRFEILTEPSGAYSIFDTELPAMAGGRTFIGLYRQEVPLVLLSAMEADGKPWALPPVSSPSNCQTNNTDPTHQTACKRKLRLAEVAQKAYHRRKLIS